MIVIPGYGTKSKAETVICLATFMGLYCELATLFGYGVIEQNSYILGYYVVLSKLMLGRQARDSTSLATFKTHLRAFLQDLELVAEGGGIPSLDNAVS